MLRSTLAQALSSAPIDDLHRAAPVGNRADSPIVPDTNARGAPFDRHSAIRLRLRSLCEHDDRG
jgi:hypothetical protein